MEVFFVRKSTAVNGSIGKVWSQFAREISKCPEGSRRDADREIPMQDESVTELVRRLRLP